MRDIRGDLRERAKLIEQAIIIEENRCKKLIDQLKRERDGKLQNLKIQLEAVNRLAEVAAWQYAARAAVSSSYPNSGRCNGRYNPVLQTAVNDCGQHQSRSAGIDNASPLTAKSSSAKSPAW